MDGFKDRLPADLTQEQFVERVFAGIQYAAGVWMMLAPLKGRGPSPVGIATAWLWPRMRPNLRELHFDWLPWATPRNKLESALNFLHRMRTQFDLFSAVEMKTVPFFEHVGRYGVVRRMGTFKNFFGKNVDGAMFQTRDVI